MRNARANSWVCTLILAEALLNTVPAKGAPVASKPAVVRGNDWYLHNSLTAGAAEVSFTYGRSGDTPLMGDWDGNGTKTPGVVRGKTWYLKNTYSGGAADIVFSYGAIGDIPIAGDWDGDGDDTPGVFRENVSCRPDVCDIRSSTWHLKNDLASGGAEITFAFGFVGRPVVGDWDEDGDDTPRMLRRSLAPSRTSNIWDINNDLDTTADFTFAYGRAGDTPTAGDWDGDGKETIGVVRANLWYLKNSLAGGDADLVFGYGRSGDRFITWL